MSGPGGESHRCRHFLVLDDVKKVDCTPPAICLAGQEGRAECVEWHDAACANG